LALWEKLPRGEGGSVSRISLTKRREKIFVAGRKKRGGNVQGKPMKKLNKSGRAESENEWQGRCWLADSVGENLLRVRKVGGTREVPQKGKISCPSGLFTNLRERIS